MLLTLVLLALPGPVPSSGPPANALQAALSTAVRVGKVPSDLHLFVGRREASAEPYRTVEIWGDGVAIEDGRRQFRLGVRSILAMIGAVLEARFDEFEETPGEEERPPSDAELAIRTRLLVQAGGVSKDVYRTMRGPRTPALEALALRLVSLCCDPGVGGVTAASLDDALRKLQSGTLAPQTLRITFQSLDEKSDASGARAGWLLSLRGRDLEVRTSSPGTGYGGILSRRLSAAELRALVTALRKGRLHEGRSALFSNRYEELSIDALGHEKVIQARRFAGLDERTHESAQKAWRSLRDVLERIYSATVATRR